MNLLMRNYASSNPPKLTVCLLGTIRTRLTERLTGGQGGLPKVRFYEILRV